MIIKAVIIFTAFIVFGNQQGSQCVKLEKYLSYDFETMDNFNEKCLHIVLYNFKKNINNTDDNARQNTKELSIYYLKSLRLLSPPQQTNKKIEFYKSLHIWMEQTTRTNEENIAMSNNITDAVNQSLIDNDILDDNRVLEVCKKTLDSLCKQTEHLEIEIHSILVNGNHTNNEYLMNYGRILLLLNERESQIFIKMTELIKKHTIIALLTDTLVNIFDIMNKVLVSLNVKRKKWNSLSSREKNIMSVFKNIHAGVIKAANFVYKLQVWNALTSNEKNAMELQLRLLMQHTPNTNLENLEHTTVIDEQRDGELSDQPEAKLSDQPEAETSGTDIISTTDIQTFIQHYNFFIKIQKNYWYSGPSFTKNKTNKFLLYPMGTYQDRISLDNESIIKPSMLGYYQKPDELEPSEINEKDVKVLLDIKLWAITITMYGLYMNESDVKKNQSPKILSQNNYIIEYNKVIKTFSEDTKCIIDEPINGSTNGCSII